MLTVTMLCLGAAFVCGATAAVIGIGVAAGS